jgi:CRISPR/Cas system CSM-associated protein Csm2 small subunit
VLINTAETNKQTLTPAIGLYGAFEKIMRAMDDHRASSSVEEYVRYFNALAFWKAHQFDYPILSAMAKD